MRSILLSAMTALLILTAGCGQKGALYIPVEEDKTSLNVHGQPATYRV